MAKREVLGRCRICGKTVTTAKPWRDEGVTVVHTDCLPKLDLFPKGGR